MASPPDANRCLLKTSSFVIMAAPPQSKKPHRLLLIPTERIAGIETALQRPPEVLAAYLRAAWEARSMFTQRLSNPVPVTHVGLAINSAYDRGMCQLHIHIDCVGMRARASLSGQRVGDQWTPLGYLPGFVAKRFDETRFAYISRELRQPLHPDESPASQTVALIPAPHNGIYVLRSHHGPGGSGAGEALLEASCDAPVQEH